MKPGVILTAIAFAVVGFCIATTPGWLPAMLYGIFIAPVVGILLHELGHLLAGWAGGWKLIVFNIKRVSLHWPNRNIITRSPRIGDDGGGFVLMLPASPQVADYRHYLLLLAGGPLASLLTFLACGFYALTHRVPHAVMGLAPEPFALATAAYAGGQLLLTAFPGADKTPNDGNKMQAAWRDQREARKFDLLPSLAAALLLNLRLRAVPPWMIDQIGAMVGEDDERSRWIAATRIGAMLDAERVDAAEVLQALANFEARYGEDDWLLTCRAFCQAAYLGQGDAARQTMSAVKQPSSLPQMDFAARAAIAMLAGENAAAKDWLRRMDLRVAALSPYTDLTFRDIRRQVEALPPA